MSQRYDITLKIKYDYVNSAAQSRHIVRLVPADLSGEQRLVAGTLSVEPTPDEWINRVDFFGNRCAELAFFKPHNELEFSVQARVERKITGQDLKSVLLLPDLIRELASEKSMGPRSPMHFIAPSKRIPYSEETQAFAKALLSPAMSIVDIVSTIGFTIFRDFKFDPKATTVETTMLEAFRGKHGVCQDFAHIMISCLRNVGIPAAYVSGFLRTRPPEGKPRLEGADAMHAWVAAWAGNDIGWIEFDPTNNVFVGADHIVIARGRDYFDVAPVKGVMRTSGAHKTNQAVDVIPVA